MLNKKLASRTFTAICMAAIAVAIFSLSVSANPLLLRKLSLSNVAAAAPNQVLFIYVLAEGSADDIYEARYQVGWDPQYVELVDPEGVPVTSVLIPTATEVSYINESAGLITTKTTCIYPLPNILCFPLEDEKFAKIKFRTKGNIPKEGVTTPIWFDAGYDSYVVDQYGYRQEITTWENGSITIIP